MGRPSIEADNNTLAPQLFQLVGPNIEPTIFVVSRYELVHLELTRLFSFLPHGTVLRGVDHFGVVDTPAIVSLLLLINGNHFAAGLQVAVVV